MHSTATDVTHGIPEDLFSGMSDQQKDDVAKLMARISERSYRRGFQQGVTIATKRPADLPRDLHGWRYRASTDKSPWADSEHVEPSVDRLFGENDGLRRMMQL